MSEATCDLLCLPKESNGEVIDSQDVIGIGLKRARILNFNYAQTSSQNSCNVDSCRYRVYNVREDEQTH